MHEDGIYFGLPSAEYHNEKALGSTSLKAIALDCVEWQYDRLRGEPKDSAALIWGQAIHARVLEGPEAFRQQFCISPDIHEYPGALKTMDDLRAHAQTIGVKGGRSKAEVAAAIRQRDNDVVIWDELMDRFAADNAGKTIISNKIYSEIEQAAQWMQADPLLSSIMENGVMTAGCSEVSIFATDDNVRLKARIDHLLPHARVDVKSFRVQRMDRIDRSAVRAIARERYDLQAAHYEMMFERGRALYKAGKVFGADDKAMALLRAAYDGAKRDPKWIWVLVKNSGAPQPLVRELELKSFVFGTAKEEINRAISTYREMRDKYGDGSIWTPRHPCEILGDGDFPIWSFM